MLYVMKDLEVFYLKDVSGSCWLNHIEICTSAQLPDSFPSLVQNSGIGTWYFAPPI